MKIKIKGSMPIVLLFLLCGCGNVNTVVEETYASYASSVAEESDTGYGSMVGAETDVGDESTDVAAVSYTHLTLPTMAVV